MQPNPTWPYNLSGSFQQPNQAPNSNSNIWTPPAGATLSDGYPDDWVEADGYPSDWIEADGYPSDWIPAASATVPGGYPDNRIGPSGVATATSDPSDEPGNALEPDGFPNDWIAASDSSSRRLSPNLGHGATGYSTTDDGFPNDWVAAGDSTGPGQAWDTGARTNVSGLPRPQQLGFVQRVSNAPATQPGWVLPVPQSGWEPWADQFIKGMQGLINFLRSRSRAGGGGGGDDPDCYSRWEAEDARCQQFWPLKEKWPYFACKEKAIVRRDRCIRNNGRPDPEEPPEYNFNDFM